MATGSDYYHAKEVYKGLCEALDEMEWKYHNDDEKFIVTFGVNGDDIPMNFVVLVDVERQLLRVMSMMTFEIPTEKRVEISALLSMINYKLAMGCFDLNIGTGEIIFKFNTCFRECLISTELIQMMIMVACNTIDMYNDQIKAVSDGNMTLGEFTERNE